MLTPIPPTDLPLLCLDAGNTSVHAAVLCGMEPAGSIRLTRVEAESSEVLGGALRGLLARSHVRPSGAAVSVRPELNNCLRQASEPLLTGPLHFVTCDDCPIEMRYKQPQALGMDRLCNAAAIHALLPDKLPGLAIDFGTATKFDLVGHHGAYEGGAIAPGLETALQGLIGAAQLLSAVDLEAPDSPIGRTTAESLASGFILGLAALTDGMVTRFSAAAGSDLTCVATGGYAAKIVTHCTTQMRVDPFLTLRGVRLLWEYRQRRSATSSA
ncbi:MAG: type III pantothenate kinase [Armatimonadetes bacterium]|nr:type III pantothenate kinase [Armatimonadota bacterium]MDE2207452.1 type III pantothenate kinase [Armatimonadota bacterium]